MSRKGLISLTFQPIRTHLEHYGDPNPGNEELRKQDSEAWNTIAQKLHSIMKQCVTMATEQGMMSTDRKHQYYTSGRLTT